MNLKQAIGILYYWQHHSGDSFTCNLYRLMQKADPENYSKLKTTFPIEAEAFEMWERSGNNGEDLFNSYLNLETFDNA